MAAPTLVSATTLGAYNNTDTTYPKATASISWDAGDRIVVVFGVEWDDNEIGTPTATGLTFSEVIRASEADGGDATEVAIFEAVAGSGGSGAVSITLSTTASGGYSWGAGMVYVFRSSSAGASAKAAASTVGITTLGDNSVIIGNVSSWQNDATITADEGTAGTMTVGNSGADTDHGNLFSFRYADTGTAGAKTVGGTETWSSPRIAVYEVQGVAAGDTTAPTAPTSVSTSSPTYNGGTVSWTQGTDAVGVTQNVIYVDGAPHATIAATTSYAITGLSSSTTYTVTVTAKDAAGNESTPSTGASLTTTAPDPTATYVTASTLVYGSTSVVGTLPAGIAAGDYLLRFVGTKPGTNAPSTPAGWTSLGTMLGTTGTTGVDTGPMRISAFGKVAAGTETGTITQTITSGNSSWTQTYLLRNETGLWDVAVATGQDTAGGTSWSAVLDAVSFATGDLCIVGSAIPTDVTTPAQFTAEAITASGITFGTMTEISEPDTTTGNDSGGFVFRQAVTAGTATVAPTVTATASGTTTNVYGPTALVRVRGLSAVAVSVTPAASTHSHAATSPTLSATLPASGVTPADATHTHAATSPTLVQHHTLAPASSTHAHASTSPTLVADNPLFTPGATLYTYADTDGAPYFSETGPGDLYWYLDTDGVPYYSATGPGTVTWTADLDGNPYYTGVATITPASSAHGHGATSPSLVQHHVIAPASATHAHAASAPTLTQHQALTPASATHAHAATQPALVQHHAITPASTTHSHAATSPTLSTAAPTYTITPAGTSHGHTATSPALVQHHTLQPANASHGHTATPPSVTPAGTIAPATGLHAHTATSPTLTQHHALVVNDASHMHVVTSPTLAARYALTPASTTHAHTATSPSLAVNGSLSPSSTTHAHTATGPTLTQHHILTVADAWHEHTATGPVLTDPDAYRDITLHLTGPTARPRTMTGPTKHPLTMTGPAL
ncbi:hypothetical protein [Actinotalea sp.]|uniref:hypothetical protein n=1 Tax=Actinotalea sp. TaxID=1872145 RepID=UPI00356403DB